MISEIPVIDYDRRYSGLQEAKSGSTFILPINFTGTPAPRVTWMRNGIPLGAMPGHVHIDTGDNYSTLTILGMEKEEGGRYEVEVENTAGSAKADFNVAVKGE